jgi:hypothetical protein
MHPAPCTVSNEMEISDLVDHRPSPLINSVEYGDGGNGTQSYATI